MKKIIFFILIILSPVLFCQRITDLPPASSTNGLDIFPFVQSGVSKKITWTNLQASIDSLNGSKISNGTIPLSKLSNSLKSYIDASGGGTIRNFPDDITIIQNPDSTLSVSNLVATKLQIDSLKTSILNKLNYEVLESGWIHQGVVYSGSEVTYIEDGSTVDCWARSGGYPVSQAWIAYKQATNEAVDNWSNSVACKSNGDTIKGYYPYVVKNGSTYYMTVNQLPDGNPYYSGDIYLYTSTDKINWTIQNSGNPVLTHSTNPASLTYYIYNTAWVIANDTIRLVVDGWNAATTSVATSYSWAPLSNPGALASHVSSNYIVYGINPDFKYIPERNAYLLILDELVNGSYDITGYYALGGTDLGNPTNWTKCPSFPSIRFNDQDLCDPYLAELHNNPTRKLLLGYVFATDSSYSHAVQSYSNITMLQLYDYSVNPIIPRGIKGFQISGQLGAKSLDIDGFGDFHGPIRVTQNLTINDLTRPRIKFNIDGFAFHGISDLNGDLLFERWRGRGYDESLGADAILNINGDWNIVRGNLIATKGYGQFGGALYTDGNIAMYGAGVSYSQILMYADSVLRRSVVQNAGVFYIGRYDHLGNDEGNDILIDTAGNTYISKRLVMGTTFGSGGAGANQLIYAGGYYVGSSLAIDGNNCSHFYQGTYSGDLALIGTGVSYSQISLQANGVTRWEISQNAGTLTFQRYNTAGTFVDNTLASDTAGKITTSKSLTIGLGSIPIDSTRISGDSLLFYSSGTKYKAVKSQFGLIWILIFGLIVGVARTKKYLVTLLLVSIPCFAQSQDSTQFKFWVGELQKTEKQLVNLDTLKIKWQGIYEYQYGNALAEKKKLDDSIAIKRKEKLKQK